MEGKEAMNILFTADRGYMKHVEDCIRSFARFRSEDGYDVYLLHSDLDEAFEKEMEERLKERVRLHFIHVDPERFQDFPESARYPRLIYYRIFAAELLPEELDRILYLDGDTLVINPLNELYQMDFGENDILACTHVQKFLNKLNQYRLGIKEEVPYINSGVILMNLAALRADFRFDEIAAYIKQHRNALTLPDQDIITALYGGKIGLLDTMKYNLSDRMLDFYNFYHSAPGQERLDLEWVRKNAVVIHYYGKQKPWNDNYRGKLDVFYRELTAGGQEA